MNPIKFTKRAKLNKNPIVQEKIKYLSNIDYSVEGEVKLKSKKNSPIFTVINTVYNGSLKFIEESIKSVLNQTYDNVELILIDHGAPIESKLLIRELIRGIDNILLLSFKQNTINEKDIYSLDSPMSKIWDAGLFASKGDLVYFLADDDKLSSNYSEKMVDLFIKNNNCVTAAPRVVSINESSKINLDVTKSLDNKNTRDKYTCGIRLAESIMNKENLVANPGGLLVLKSDLVIESGGFDFLNDITQFFRFAIYGDSGYDNSATLFWRHHEKQSNKETFKKGTALQYRFLLDYLKPYKMYELHSRICGKNFADKFEKYLGQTAVNGVYSALRKSFSYSFISGIKVLKSIFKECPYDIKFISVLKIPFFVIEDKKIKIKKYLKRIILNL